MPGLAGSDGSPLVAWPFVVKFLVLPRRPPAVHGLRCHHPPPRAPPRNCGRYACGTAFHRRVLCHVPSSRGTIEKTLIVSWSLSLLFAPSPFLDGLH